MFWKKKKKAEEPVEEVRDTSKQEDFLGGPEIHSYEDNNIFKIAAYKDLRAAFVNCGVRFDCGKSVTAFDLKFSVPESLIYKNREIPGDDIIKDIVKKYTDTINSGIPEEYQEDVHVEAYIRKGEMIMTTVTDRYIQDIISSLPHEKVSDPEVTYERYDI